MKSYKIIYYVGESIGLETVVNKGILLIEDRNISIVSNEERIALNMVYRVDIVRLNALGTILKIVNGSYTIFLAAYRVYLNIGTGFIIANYFGTINIRNLLDATRCDMNRF
ncbi:MAG: hypothetical protein VB086_07495 [Clostridiaceae bacterium]|nr:hypothetical protein [Clostridiaceae bacterium]